MTNVTSQPSISLDGYVAGPNQSIDDPIAIESALEQAKVIASPAVTRCRYRVVR